MVESKENEKMNKPQLVDAMATKTGLTKKDMEAALVAFQETVTEELAEKGKVQLVGFGTFETVERKARTGRNPKTNEEIQIPATTAPKLKFGKSVKEKVAGK